MSTRCNCSSIRVGGWSSFMSKKKKNPILTKRPKKGAFLKEVASKVKQIKNKGRKS